MHDHSFVNYTDRLVLNEFLLAVTSNTLILYLAKCPVLVTTMCIRKGYHLRAAKRLRVHRVVHISVTSQKDKFVNYGMS